MWSPMKYVYTLLIFAVSSPAYATDMFYRPTDQCLAKISAAMKAIGNSKIESENEIDFEGFMDISGNRFEFMYYKKKGGSKTLDITGRGSINLTVKTSSEFQGLTDIEDCDVSNARIIEEFED